LTKSQARDRQHAAELPHREHSRSLPAG
jgi:hypothetical protein